MARDFSKNTSNYLRLGAAAISPLIDGAARISVHCWANVDSTDTGVNDNRLLEFAIDGGTTGLRLALRDTGSLRSLRVAGRSQSGDGLQQRTGAIDLPLGSWHALGGVLDFAGDAITPYVNGVADNGAGVSFIGSAYAAGTPGVNDMIGAGSSAPPSTTAEQTDGRIAEVAVWREDIGAAGFAQLALGFSPLLIQSRYLVFYMPLLGFGGNAGPGIDLRAARSGIIAGTLAIADHPRIFRPASPFVGSRPAVSQGWRRAVDAFTLPVLSSGTIS